MLILTRKIGESIIIGDNITVTVLGVKNNHMKLGIEAPKGIPVHREEIFIKIKEQAGLAVVKVGVAKAKKEKTDQ